MTKRRLTATPTEIAKDIVEEFDRNDVHISVWAGYMGHVPCNYKRAVKLIADKIKLNMYYEKGA